MMKRTDEKPIDINDDKNPATVSPRITAPAYYFKEGLTIKEAAEYTGLSSGTLYILTHDRRIPFYKPLGKKIYFKRSELDAFMFRNKQSAFYEVSAAAEAVLNGEA
jgi:excisionase family DNA binding protein